MSNTVYQIARRREGVKAKKLRREGIVPAVIYGKEHRDSVPVELTLQEANRLLKENTSSSIIKLDGLDKTTSVIVKEVQRNGATFLPEHIDFQSISLREIIHVSIPLHILGEDQLQRDHLLFQPNLQEIELKGPAEDIPERLEFDVSELKFEDKVFLSEIKVPEGIEVLGEDDDLIGIVLSAQLSEEEPEETEADEDAAEVPLVDEEETEE
ncbi:50S ribosomal protein L25 [Proteiniclasticum sp. C24MP]|uniref:50S ribosomal protein L25 n=1 Tax=Proteiniclasticum sp. C24MP TaxID=3374101 RepID=UPI0037549B65